MGNKTVPQLLARRWWIGFIVLIITLGATVYYTNQQVPIYSARATYIARLSETITEEREVITALGFLSRENDMLTTYSELARSRAIRLRAADSLNPSDRSYLDLPVRSRVIPGTSILEISVEGANPGQVRDYANMVGVETASYANPLYTTFRIEPLDLATIPGRPISPNRVFNLVIGGVLGLFIGFLLMLISVWLSGAYRASNTEERQDPQVVTTIQRNYEDLQRESAALRKELTETRRIFRETILETRILGDIIRQANGRK